MAGDDLVDATELVARAQAGDEDAWCRLVAHHVGLVHAISRGYGLPDGAAAEVNQLVWLRLVEHLPRIRTPDALGGWIAATTRSLCLAPERSADRSGYVAAAVGRTVSGEDRAATHANGAGRVAPGSAPVGPAAVGAPPMRESARLAVAFARIGARCQRLLRLAATRPRPSAEEISAALDLATVDVEPACLGCLDRLRRLAAAADDPDVLDELQSTLVAGDRVPEGWWDAAHAAYAWQTLDAAPAQRIYDSTTVAGLDLATTAAGARTLVGTGAAGPRPGPGPAGVQGTRRMRFSAPHDSVELVIDANGDEVLLAGQLVSGRVAAVTARWPGGERTTRTDDAGAFRFHGLPVAPLCVQVAGDRPLKTGWILP